MSYRNNVGLGIKSTAGLRLWKSGMDIMPLRIHSSLMNCFNSHFLRFYNELKFHILSRDGKMHGLPIKISILSKNGHSTFMLSTIEMLKFIKHKI